MLVLFWVALAVAASVPGSTTPHATTTTVHVVPSTTAKPTTAHPTTKLSSSATPVVTTAPSALNLCHDVLLEDIIGKEVVNQDVLESFKRQITHMNDDEKLSDGGVFSTPRFEGGKKVSDIHWTLCQSVHPKFPKCPETAGCCEVFVDGHVRACGRFDEAAFVFDNFLSVTKSGISFIAGISLRYNSSGEVVPDGSFGLTPAQPPRARSLGFIIDLKCDPLVHFFQLSPDAVVVAGGYDLRVRVESQFGCVANTHSLDLSSWKIMFYVVAPVAMVAGVLLLFLGWRLFRLTSLVLGLFFGLSIAGVVIMASVFAACEATKPKWDNLDFWNWSHECTFHYLTANAYVGWIASVSGLVFGLILSVTAYRKPSFGGVLISMAAGTWMADLLYVTTFSVLRQHWIVLLISAVFIPFFALVGGCLPAYFKRPFFIAVISLTGAYLICWGAGAYTSFFPSVVLLGELGPKWQYGAFLGAIAVLAVLGMIVQFTVTGGFDWDSLMESGLCPGKGKRRGGRPATDTLLPTSSEDLEMEPQVKAILRQISDVDHSD